MRAVRFHPPGGPEQLIYTDSEPELSSTLPPNSCLIKVHAVSVIHTELYWPIYQNKDGSYNSHIPGHDFAGVIVDIKPSSPSSSTSSSASVSQEDTSTFKVGDEVIAFTSRRNHEGGMAAYALADLDQITHRPHNLSLIEAASIPLSSLTAWQALFDQASLPPSPRILIMGAAGGTGIWTIQFAKRLIQGGAHIFGTGSTARSRELFTSLGGDVFINYKTDSVENCIEANSLDLILDCVGVHAVPPSMLQLLKEDTGLVISICNWEIQQLAEGFGKKGLFFIVHMDAVQLRRIVDLVERKEVRTVIDRVFPLKQGREAFEFASGGHVNGKIVLSVQKEK